MQEQISFREVQGPDRATSVLVAAGDIDVLASGHIGRWVRSALGSGARRLVLDLSDAGYLDSRAIEALIDAERKAVAAAGELWVVSPADSRLQTIFELTHLDRYLQLAPTRADALAAA